MHGQGVALPSGQRVAQQRADGGVERHRVRRRPVQRLGQAGGAGSDDVERNAVGSKEGAQVQERRCGRRLRRDLAERHLPDGGNRPLQVPRLAPQLRPITLLQQIGVTAKRRPGLLAVRRRLVQRQRQVAQRVRDPVGGPIVAVRSPLLQEGDRLRPLPSVQRHRSGDAAPGRVARGDEDVAAGHPWQGLAHDLRILGIVVDEQPSAVRLQPPQHCGDDEGLLGRIRLVQPQGAGERHAIGGEQGRLFRPQPPAHVVVVLEAVGVFRGQGRLADAAEPVDRGGLRQRRRRSRDEAAAKPLDQLLPAGEVGVAARHVPDRRQGAGKARFLGDLAPGLRRGEAGERRLAGGLGPVSLYSSEQPIAGGVPVVQAEEVDVDDLRQEPPWLAVAHPHRQQQPERAGGIFRERRRPFRGGEPGGEEVRGKDGDGPLRLRRRLLHLQGEVRARPEVPRLENDGVAGLLQDPADPFRPGAIRARIADEEVLLCFAG